MVSKFKYISRIFALYCCVMIPLICVNVFIMQSSFQQAEKREEWIMKQILQETVEELGCWYADFQNQAIAVGQRRNMSPTVVLSNAIDEQNAVNQLGFVNLFNRLTDEIVLYYGDNKVYTSKGLTRISTYFDTTLKCTEESTVKGVAALSATSATVVLLKTNGVQDFLMYHYPIIKHSSTNGLSVQFIVPVNQINEVLKGFAFDKELLLKMSIESDALYFLLENGECMILRTDEFDTFYDKWSRVLQSEVGGINMNIEIFFEPSLSYDELRHFQNKCICLQIIGVFFAFLISFSLSRRRWGRLQALITSLPDKVLAESEKRAFSDEFGYINNVLELSRKECDLMEKNVQIYRQGMIRQTAKMIFHGIFNKHEVIQQLLAGCNMELSEEYYYLSGIVIINEEAELRQLEKIFTDYLYYEDTINGKRVIIFLDESVEIDQNGAIRMESLNYLYKELHKVGISVSRIVSSQIYNRLSMINYAYLEVVSLLESPLISEAVIECWDIGSKFSAEKLTKLQVENLEWFINALEQYDFHNAEAALYKLSEGDDSNINNCCYVRYCIRQALILAIRSSNFGQTSELMSRIVQIKLTDRMSFEEQIAKEVKKYCESNEEPEQLKIIVEYLKKNYRRYDLSKKEVENYAGINKTQMSRIFKNQLGLGYFEYITKLRMEDAQNLLVNTNLPVKDIVQMVGYVDQASFTKKFKTYFGMSPTDYRNKKNEAES